MDRRQRCTPEEVAVALQALDGSPKVILANAWPNDFRGLDQAGLYSWWVDEAGADQLSQGLGLPLEAGRIYAGQTGATAWPSGARRNTTLRGRIGGNHLNGRIRGSTFRFTLAAALREPIKLTVTGPTQMARTSEADLSRWIRAHLAVAAHPFAERDALEDLEDQVLSRLDPPLNIEGMPSTRIRDRLQELRAAIARAAEAEPPAVSTRAPVKGGGPAATLSPRPERSPVTLHDELADILRANGNRWMTTQELADLVNARGRYKKTRGRGDQVTAFQVHGRTRNYSRMFERQGSAVRLSADRRWS